MIPASFLAAHAPFCDLSEDGRANLEAQLEISFVPRGTRILERGGPPSDILYLLRKGSVRLEL
ncbi:MAG: cyclic nucleotide-binding protein, partial [Acidobacteriota bacterium]